MSAETYLLRANTQLTHTSLRIGAGNFWEDTYMDADSALHSGLTAGLWLYFRDQPELNQHVRAHPGMVMALGGYTITVGEITNEGGEEVVALEIAP